MQCNKFIDNNIILEKKYSRFANKTKQSDLCCKITNKFVCLKWYIKKAFAN